MDMSKAAIAPRQPIITEADRKHPLFPIYNEYRAGCSRMLVQASHFKDWLSQYERELVNAKAASDPRYSKFLDWMIDNKGGARKCPAGMFPHNFYFWLEGGRW